MSDAPTVKSTVRWAAFKDVSDDLLEIMIHSRTTMRQVSLKFDPHGFLTSYVCIDENMQRAEKEIGSTPLELFKSVVEAFRFLTEPIDEEIAEYITAIRDRIADRSAVPIQADAQPGAQKELARLQEMEAKIKATVARLKAIRDMCGESHFEACEALRELGEDA